MEFCGGMAGLSSGMKHSMSHATYRIKPCVHIRGSADVFWLVYFMDLFILFNFGVRRRCMKKRDPDTRRTIAYILVPPREDPCVVFLTMRTNRSGKGEGDDTPVSFKYVYIPCDMSKPMEELTMTTTKDGVVGCLIGN